jgi:hypothetical protein
MIKRFTKDRGDSYHNIFQLAWLFFIAELHEYLSIFGAYDITNQVYNPRRVWWVLFFTTFAIVMSSTFLFTSFVYLANTFGVF